MQDLSNTAPLQSTGCTGSCKGCGKVHIRVFENHSLQAQQLNNDLNAALKVLKVPHKIISTAAPEDARIFGVTQFPALMLEHELVCEGYIPSLQQIVAWLMERYINHLKLHRLERLTVPVDLSEESGHALRFAWEMAKTTGSSLEVIYVMDSIFEGSRASPSGFLSGYGKTMQSELDAFVKNALPELGAAETPQPAVITKVLFGFPDATILEYSSQCDFMVIGATGRSAFSKRLLGSVSAEVSRSSHCPVLLVPQNAVWNGFKDLVYTSDFESLDPIRVVQAAAFATRVGAHISFVHVGPATGMSEVALQEKFRLITSLLPEELRQTTMIKLVGDEVMEALYNYTTSHKADLLVFVTHERRSWEHLLHKSITSEALTDAKLPMLVIHDEDEQV
jgi:nucleotide-binding universal stress UspA family protein